ncbi:dihydroorotase [Bradyrhizobium elkanii]|uniref:Allantoinase n=1 Tax=Bradyrhizobium elkanii TaxID=29448 RepID=A0A8I1YD59_BRAEL|nr:dihydroorotase family protein [Bradyrhizobium elkanii]MBP1296369.1 allantoinase [Bradyrhizobium elkanii]
MADSVFTGTIVLADRMIEDGYVLVGDGKVQAVGAGAAPAGERHGGPGFLVLPGAIDAQVHSRSQLGQEDFVWSTRSAAAGGVTTIVDMPYDDNCLIATAERFRTKVKEAGAQARVDFALYATIDPAEGAARVDELVDAGAAAFKFSTFGTHPTRFPRIPPQTLYACFAAVGKRGLMAGIHNENDEMVRAFMAEVEAKGITDYTAHGLSRPPVTEALATVEVYELGAAAGCPVHIVHCSIGRGYELAAAYRAQGHDATIEACVHYLTLDEENDVRRLGGKAKINPPLRPRREVEALWHHLAAGNVTIVSTDHVSWSEDRKTDPNMLKNASGIPGLEALYGLLLKGLDQRQLPLTHAARLLALNPAALFRITHAKGALQIGRDADIVLMRRDPYRYRAAESGNNFVGWSPYDGIELPFRPIETYLRGDCVAADGKVIAGPGTGQFVSPVRAS